MHVGVERRSARPDDVFLWRRHAEHGGLSRLARLGRSINYYNALGDDTYSDWMIDEWQAEGVGTNSVLRVPTRLPGFYAIRADARG